MLFPDLACGFIGMDILLASTPLCSPATLGDVLLCELCSGLPETLTCGSQIYLPGVDGHKPGFSVLALSPS